jgi:hypothetical protein
MARNRVIYQSEALFTKEPSGHHTLAPKDQLLRVQDISHGVELNRTDVNEFGQLSAIERKIIEPPTVSLDFSYYSHGGRNEKLLGFTMTTDRSSDPANLKQAISGFMTGTVDEKNYYIAVSEAGDDLSAEAAGTQEGVIGIGNGSVTSYSLEAAVGDIPSSSISVEASNIIFQGSGTNVKNPCVNNKDGSFKFPQGAAGVNAVGNLNNFPMASDTGTKSGDFDVACVRPGDITINFNDAGNPQPADAASPSGEASQMGGAYIEGNKSAHIQNFTLDVPLARTPLSRIGSVYPYAREMDTPITITLSVSALMADIADGTLNDLLCNNDLLRNVRITLREPCADDANSGSTDEIVQEYLLKGCQLDSQNFAASIGDNKTVDLVFSCQQSGANGTGNGLYMWGTSTSDYAIGTDPKVYGQEADYPNTI